MSNNQAEGDIEDPNRYVYNEAGERLPENIRKIDPKRKKSENLESKHQQLKNCLKNHFVFYNLNDQELENIVKKMFYCEVPKDQCIFKQGDNAMSFFILDQGGMEVIVNDKAKRELKPNDGFGELALLYKAPRSATVKANDKCYLYGIDRSTFRRAVEEMITKEYEENRKFMEQVRFFHNLNNEQKDAIAAVLIVQKFYKNQMIVQEGDPASSFYIIKEGTVTVMKAEKDIRKLSKGDSFGEQALYYNTVRQMSVRAEDEVKCLALGRDTLTKILGDQVHAVTFRNLQKWAFDKNNLLSKLNKNQVDKVLNAMKIQSYKAGDVIIKKGTLASQMRIIVVIEGSLKKSKHAQIVVSKAQAWGEEYLLENKKNATAEEDIIMDTDGVIAEITIEAFLEQLQTPGQSNATIEEIIKNNEKQNDKKMQKADPEKRKKAQNIKLQELIKIGHIKDGQLGPIYLVKSKYDGQLYALKCFDKQKISEQNLGKYTTQEKAVLELVNFPFIVQYARSFKDRYDVYFLVEYVKGIELLEVIREIGLLNTYDSQFYTASMILMLEYLHHHNIIYRDMKPDNIIVDDQGYLKVVDLGTAKILKGKHGLGNRTTTIIGTPHYMAPEIICGKGYNCFVDLWSVGICLFEFMCGYVPFGEDNEDPYDIYEKIIKEELKYPQHLKDKKARKLMDQLLRKVPEERLGSPPYSYQNIKQSPWFENFDWDKLLDKELKAPFIPDTQKMITDSQIKQAESQDKIILDDIQDNQKKREIDKENFTDPQDQWDKDF